MHPVVVPRTQTLIGLVFRLKSIRAALDTFTLCSGVICVVTQGIARGIRSCLPRTESPSTTKAQGGRLSVPTTLASRGHTRRVGTPRANKGSTFIANAIAAIVAEGSTES